MLRFLKFKTSKEKPFDTWQFGKIDFLVNLKVEKKGENWCCFAGLPCSQELNQSPRGDPRGVLSMPRNLEKVQKYHQPAKWAIIFWGNLFILLLQVCYIFGLPHDLYLGTLSMRIHLILFSAVAYNKNRAKKKTPLTSYL